MNMRICNEAVEIDKTQDIYPHDSLVTRETRNRRVGHKSGVIWLTGLSGAGKSTIATGVEQRLFNKNYLISILDGDTLRTGLNSDLDFSTQARQENVRRTGEVASLFEKTGHIVIASFISPHHKGRQTVKNIIGESFCLVHVDAAIDDCISRDPKGLYKKAANGAIANFTGVGQSYEKPVDPELVINTSENDIEACINKLSAFIEDRFSF